MAASSSSSSGEQQYSLRWNDFHSSILSSFRHLRDEEDFVDVTLACDSSSFTAHKVVLSACSPYFRRLLKANPCQHPIVILRDVASSDMESLLRFMYHGEVHVGQEQLAAFLKTAQMLQVRGLADVNSAATAKIPPPSSSGGYNGSAPATPRNPWQDNGRGDLNESGLSPPPEKRPRSNTPTLGNHVEPKTDLQDSLLGQALEGGPTLHTTPTNNVQAQSTGEDSNSMSDNEEDMSNNDSILNSVKTEPSDILNDSMEHHRNSFPAALLGLPGLIPGPSGIHAANQDPNYGRWQPSGGDGSSSSSGWLPATSSARNDHAGSGTHQSGAHNSKGQDLSSLLQQHHHHHLHATSQPSQQHALNALNSLNSLNTEQLTIMHQKLQNNLQSLQQQQTTTAKGELNLMLQSCSKDKIESMALFHQRRLQQQQQHQPDSINQSGKPKCPECGKIYSNNSNLKQHIVNVHTVQTEFVSCHVCNKQFKTKQYLQIHLLSMHGIRKRKSYPLYQIQTHGQVQQQSGSQGSGSQQSQQQYPALDRWSDDKQ
ncbi:broad-complex core protein isoforms 1/2/3/4/5 isoform X2 [Hylaeus anthracinus]|uniref:broad-complex core protein isoforms 1/2/3/4/5 isoform X2 n=1 Tax=Hylaeus volcanicus TaxID=313075 RepID=UPI0023B78551|nr:broad-complex core protein isoforms 1/2/3/4/5 isoform X2 [Hylaeus volcanicus]XP_054011822.1 broad-complex core protein isoforms 1/2/3/4/5 isoform X2 [Hylaeus anthracinus]